MRRVEAAVSEIERRGGIVVYDTSWPEPGGLSRVRRTLAAHAGKEWFGRPRAVVFPLHVRVDDEDLRLVSRLGSVETVHLDGYHSRSGRRSDALSRAGVTDRGLAYLERLTGLKQLTLRGAAVTPAAVANFRQRAPNCRVVDNPAERLAFFKL
ncbi:MAG: hypothetical protein AAF596_06860 [Planctomycetota bacterium]